MHETPFFAGLCSVTFRQLPAEKIIALAAGAGLQAIEWGADVHAPPADARRLRDLGARTSAAGLLPLSYGSYVSPGVTPATEVASALDAAAALGAESIRVWAGPRGVASALFSADERQTLARALAASAAQAADAGLRLVIEYHPATLVDTPSAAATLIREVDHPNAFLSWQPDPGESGVTAIPTVLKLQSHLAHLHVFSWLPDGRRRPLAEDVDLWRAAIRAAIPDRYGRRRCAFLEFVVADDPAALAGDALTLRQLLSEPKHPEGP